MRRVTSALVQVFRRLRLFSWEGQRLVLQSKLSLDRAATALSESVPTGTCCNSSSGETLRLWNGDLALKCAKLWMTKYGGSCNNFVAPCLANRLNNGVI